ncbi:MAG: hypothetical protein ABUL68_04345 [Pseudomonadota bacterium]
MNTTTANDRTIRFTPQDLRLPAGLRPQIHAVPRHDFLVLNAHPDFTPGTFVPPATPAAPRSP